MRLKSYFADKVQSAIALARQDLGPDAMLVHSKKTEPGASRLGEYEVVFAVDDQPIAAESPSVERDPTLDRLADDIGMLRRQVERMAASLGYAAAANAAMPFMRPDAAQTFASLIRAGVHPEIAQDFVVRASDGPGSVGENLASLLWSAVKVAPWPPNSEGRVAALIGPPGGGKTTTLAKLATVYGVRARASTIVISTDVFRIAAADQLRTLCSILGVGFACVETPIALEQAITENRHKSLILIDTPGVSAKDSPDLAQFERFFASRPGIEKHLVLPASMKGEDISRAADRYAGFGYTHLIFTKLDETATFGCILNEAHTSGRPISFLTDGQEVPEDIHPADSARVNGLIFGIDLETGKTNRAAA